MKNILEKVIKMSTRLFDINSEYRDLLNVIRCKPGIEKTVLAKELDIAFKTLNKQMDDLQEVGILSSDSILKVNENTFYMCGLSVGGSHCKVVIVDAEYRVLSLEKFEEICKRYNVFQQKFFSDEENKTKYGYKYFETPDDRVTLQLHINEIINDIIKLRDISEREKSMPPIISIGIALTGSIDTKKQIIVRSHSIDYLRNVSREMLLDLEVLKKIRQHGIELIIDHNAKAMAVCEKFSLYHSDNDNFEYHNKKNIACLYLGSGIGCGIILNNRLIRGCRNFSGELGHIQVPRYPDFIGKSIEEKCTCGASNCLEHLIIHDVFEMDRKSFRKATSKDIRDKIESFENESHEKYISKMKILGYYVGWAIDAVTKLLNVGLIIFSGKMTGFTAKAWSYIEPTVGDLDYAILDCQRVLSKYGALAPSIGAAILSTYPADELIEWKI